MTRRVPHAAILLTLALVMASLLGACARNPTTGRRSLNMLSTEEEIAIGVEQGPVLINEFGGKVPDPVLQEYVQELGLRLAATVEVDDPRMATLPWEFTLLNSDVINAFALPGGKVFISRALAAEMTNEAQMAAVLGHEIGHVTARHANERMGDQLIWGIGGAIGGAILGGVIGRDTESAGIGAAAGGTIGSVVALSYSRDQEIEADRLGMRYMERIKYDPSAAIEVQEILKREAEKHGSRPPEILSTHPSSETRINELRKRLDKYYQHTFNNPEYVKNPERYQREFLSRLNSLPPPPKQTAMNGEGAGGMARGFWADPSRWCAHCAAGEH